MTTAQQQSILISNPFRVFNISPQFEINLNDLNNTLHQLQKIHHPDNFVDSNLTALAIRVSAHINSAYSQLVDPIKRSLLVLNVNGFDLNLSTDNQLSEEFLQEQVEFYELIENSKSIKQLELLEKNLQDKQTSLLTQLAIVFNQKQFATAITLTKQLAFYQKLLDVLNNKINSI